MKLEFIDRCDKNIFTSIDCLKRTGISRYCLHKYSFRITVAVLNQGEQHLSLVLATLVGHYERIQPASSPSSSACSSSKTDGEGLRVLTVLLERLRLALTTVSLAGQGRA